MSLEIEQTIQTILMTNTNHIVKIIKTHHTNHTNIHKMWIENITITTKIFEMNELFFVSFLRKYTKKKVVNVAYIVDVD